MPKLKFIGSFEEGKSRDASQGRAVNMYAERNALTNEIAFYPTPGMRVWNDTGIGGACSGMYVYDGDLYVVMNNKLLKISQLGTITTLGDLSGTWARQYTEFSDNGSTSPGGQLLISNIASAYIYDGTALFRIDNWRSGSSDATPVPNNLDGGPPAAFLSDTDIAVGLRVVNTDTGLAANVTAVTSDRLLALDANIFLVGGENYDFGAAAYPIGSSVEFFDGYFLATNDRDLSAAGDRGEFSWSTLWDGRAWAFLDKLTASRSNDALLAIKAIGRNLYMLGQDSVEIFYDAGTVVNTFKPKHVMRVGLAHEKSIQKVGDSLIFVGTIPHEGETSFASMKQVIVLKGTQHQVISSTKINRLLSDERFANTYSLSSTYTLDGHLFYKLVVPSIPTTDNKEEGRTFVYNVTESVWIEEETKHTADVEYRGNPLLFHKSFNSYYLRIPGNYSPTAGVICGSNDSDILYEVDPNTFGNIGLVAGEGIEQPIRRELMSTPISDDDDHLLRHKRVVIECNTGHKAAAISGHCTLTVANTLRCDYMHFDDDGLIDNTMTVHNITDGTSAGINSVTDNQDLVLDADIFAKDDKFTVDLGVDPEVTLEWTDDGGVTWKGPITRTLGGAGDSPIKIVFSNLGISRDRTYRLRCDDLANFVVVDAYVYVDLYKRYS